LNVREKASKKFSETALQETASAGASAKLFVKENKGTSALHANCWATVKHDDNECRIKW
jgi:hypothetical protein